jgi:predicted nucleotidyltransferase
MKEEEKKLLSWRDILPQLKEIKKEIAKILGTNDFELIVFGSYARGEAREDSDLDLALKIKKIDISLFELIDIKERIEKIINKKVDFNTYNSFGNIIKKEIQKEGVLI